MLVEAEVQMGNVKYLWLERRGSCLCIKIFIDAIGNLLLLLFVLFTLALCYNRAIESV